MKKKRALADKASKFVTGNTRYLLYRKGISRINDSINSGYYLEAITLCESLIADRLESRLKFLTNTDKYSFETLWNLQEGVRKYETDIGLISLINWNLDSWRKDRNNALHAIAKLEDKKIETWENRVERCKKVAKEGEAIRKEVFKIVGRLRK
jgi:hypothetical protein